MELGFPTALSFVPGASAGIGRAIVDLLAAEGAHVFGASRNPDALDGPRITAVAVDLTQPNGAEELVRATLDRHGPRPST